MSDEERDAGDGAEAGGTSVPAELGNGVESDPGSGDLAAIADPALASRLETIHRSMSTLGMRIDALVTSTTSYRSALTDRLNEYAELVNKLTRSQASDLEEYRRANERTLADLRRGLTTSEETLERVGARIDSMLTDAESADDSSRRVLAEVRSILEAQENLGRFLTESLDQFGEQVVGRLSASEQAAARQLEALQAAVADVESTPDPALSLVDDRLAGIEDRLAVVASNDAATAMGNRFDTLHAALEELGQNLQSGIEGASDGSATVERLDRIERELSSAGQVSTESFGEIAGLRAKIDAILEAAANESSAVTATLEQLKETLQDLASGEVMGALWDEVRQVRATVEALVDRDERTVDPGAVEALREDVTGLTSSVRDLLEQAEVFDASAGASEDTGYFAALAADVASLRAELADGLLVEPSDAFGSSVEALRTDLVALGERLTEAAPAESDPSAAAQLSDDVEAELRAVRTGVEGIIGRLDEGLVLASDDDGAPLEGTAELADQVAALRDLVSTEFERTRQLVEGGGGESLDLTPLTARLDRLHDDLSERDAPDRAASASTVADLSPVLAALDEVQEGIAHLIERPTPDTTAPTSAGSEYATVDPDVIDLLREEIRTAGSVSDDLVETLSTELKALRRRIRLRAEGEIFSDEQLQIIADAVALKLGD